MYIHSVSRTILWARPIACDVLKPKTVPPAPPAPHDEREQLVLEPRGRDREVDERELGLKLGRVVRVRELGVQEEPEARVHLDLVLARHALEDTAVDVRGPRRFAAGVP